MGTQGASLEVMTENQHLEGEVMGRTASSVGCTEGCQYRAQGKKLSGAYRGDASLAPGQPQSNTSMKRCCVVLRAAPLQFAAGP